MFKQEQHNLHHHVHLFTQLQVTKIKNVCRAFAFVFLSYHSTVESDSGHPRTDMLSGKATGMYIH